MGAAVGDELPPLVIESVSVEAMKTVAALLHDPNPIHFDLETLQRLGMGDRPVNQGPNNMAYIVAMLSRYAGGPENVRKLRVRFLGNVLGGDRLTARGVISNVREENGATVADVDVWLERSAEDVVLKGAATITVG